MREGTDTIDTPPASHSPTPSSILYLCPLPPSLSVFAEVGVTDLRSDVEIGRLDLQLGGLIDCCSFRARSDYQAR